MTEDEILEQQRVAIEYQKLQEQQNASADQKGQLEFAQEQRDFGPERASIEAGNPDKPEGLGTDIGNVVDAITSPVKLIDNTLEAAANATEGIPIIENITRGAADIAPDQEQAREIIGGIPVVGKSLVGLEAGTKAGAMLPFSIIANAQGQQAPWNEVPSLIKDDFLAKSTYDISKLLTATGIYGRFLKKIPGYNKLSGFGTTAAKKVIPPGLQPIAAKAASQYLAGNVTESAIETLAFDSPDDYILSRTFAKGIGQWGNTMGMDGEEITRRLLDGEGLGYRAWGTLGKFGHNLGINIFFPRALRAVFRKPIKALTETAENVWTARYPKNVELVAKETGVTPDDISAVVDDPVQAPKPSSLVEPSEQVTTETMTNAVVKDAVGDVSPTGFMVSATRPIDDVDFQTPYWQTYDALAKDKPASFAEALEVITAALKRFPDAVQIRAGGLQAATQFLMDNRSFVTKDYRRFLSNLKEEFFNRSDVGELGLEESAIVTQEAAKNFWTDPGANTVVAIAMRDANTQFIEGSRQLHTLDSAGQDWKGLLPALRNIVAAGESYANLYRRWQGSWSAQGANVQNKVLSAIEEERYYDLFDMDREMADTFRIVDQEELFRANPEIDPEQRYITDIFDRAIEGDEKALQAVKDLTGIASIQDAARPMDWSNLTSDSMKDAFYEGAGLFGVESRRTYYALNLLGRLRTAVFAAGSNLARYTIQPIAATLGQPFITLQTSPQALKNIDNYTDNFTLWTAGARSIKDAAKVSIRAFKQNETIMTSNARWNNQSMNLKQLSDDLDRKFDALMQHGQLTVHEANMATASYLARKTALNPVIHTVPRALMATDEGFKLTAGTSWAGVQAQRKANQLAAAGKAPSDFDYEELFEEEMKKVFINGDPLKGFAPTATEAKRYAEMMTFQTPIDTRQNQGSISGQFNNIFGWLEQGAADNPMMNWAFPFMKTVWGLSNQGATMMVGAVPGAPALFKALDPDFRAALNGERGEAMQMMVKSNLSAGLGLFWVTAGAAATGTVYITRSSGNKQGEMRSALVIDHGDGQRLELGLDRMDPIVLPMGMAVALVQEFKDGHISRGDYQSGMESLLGDISTLFLDKSFLAGLEQTTDLLNTDTFKYKAADTLGNLTGSVFGIGPMRMFSDWSNGFISPTRFNNEDFFGNYMRAFLRRSGGDIFTERPVFTDPYTGKARTSRLMREDANVYERWGSGIAAELIPFKFNETNAANSVVREMGKWDYKPESDYMLKADEDTPFVSANQIATFSNDVYNPKYGDLKGKLEFLFTKNTRYKTLVKAYNKARKRDNQGFFPRPMDEHEEKLLRKIKGLISATHRAAKKDALLKGNLRGWYQEQKLEQYNKGLAPQYRSDNMQGEESGLYAFAAKQDTPLASQVRDILDFA